jgi:ABC-2 type transport system permease protein
LRLREFAALLRKERRELFTSRAWWILLVIIGPLVGHSFITAVNLYAEASGVGGGPAALAQGLSPLDGMLTPTLGAYDLAATLLFPFIAIRIISSERESGAWKLVQQWPPGMGAVLSVKALALLMGWVIAWVPALIALGLWTAYGGHLAAGETLNLFLGHFLIAGIIAGVSVAAAAILPGGANAAILVLAFTVGTWALDFIAAGRGGLIREMAGFTPTAALRSFEQGQLRWNVVVVSLLVGLLGFALAGAWLRMGQSSRVRMLQSIRIVILFALVLFAAAALPFSNDVSENRHNSFSVPDEKVLSTIRQPLKITIYLAAEDPRLTDFERNILVKLKRSVHRVPVIYPLAGSSGLFEASGQYGEIWYEYGGRKVTSRSTTEPIVLDTIYQLTGVAAPATRDDPEYPGYPMSKTPRGAALLFYALWPAAVVLLWWSYSKITGE